MCGRVILPTWQEMLEVAYDLQAELSSANSVEWESQVRPGGQLPALMPNEQSGQLQLATLTWGYTLPQETKLVYNSRIEKAESSMWRNSFEKHRALVPVAAFFEPHHSEIERNLSTGREGKRQYQFTNPSPKPLLLGAVHNNERISIVTTEPNTSVKRIHPRMPLVLSFDEVPTWLGLDWRSLADRSNYTLVAKPEFNTPNQPEQLSLFDI